MRLKTKDKETKKRKSWAWSRANTIVFSGFDFIGGSFKNNAATFFVTLKHWDERKVPATALVGELFMKTAHIKEALVLAKEKTQDRALNLAKDIQTQGRVDEMQAEMMRRQDQAIVLADQKILDFSSPAGWG